MASSVPDFSKAAFAREINTCNECQQPLVGNYYRKNDAMVCESCAMQTRTIAPESVHGPFARGVAFGAVGALLGCALFAFVETAFHFTIGYLAIACGYFVARGMKMGSEGRGGRKYQIAAAVLTYLSVSMAFVPEVLYAVSKDGTQIAWGRLSAWMYLLKMGLVSPVLDLQANAFGGIIGLIILAVGIRYAWQTMAGSEFRSASGDVVSGPYSL